MSGDRRDLGDAAQEDRHLVAERLGKAGFDPGGDLARILLIAVSKITLPLARKVATSPKPSSSNARSQFVVLDPATTKVHPAQEGDIAIHPLTL